MSILYRVMTKLAWVLIILFCFQFAQAQAPLPPCEARPANLSEPWIRIGFACIEQVAATMDAGELAFATLASSPDGMVYATRPNAGQVIRLTDTDADGLPETAEPFADNLFGVFGLAWADGSLFAATGQAVVRIDAAGRAVVIAADLPASAFGHGGLLVAEGRLFLGVGAACEACPALQSTDDLARGGVISMALDGTDLRIEATGLRAPRGLAALQGEIYVTDTADSTLADMPMLDEINRLVPGADYGFPFCAGARIAVTPGAACAQTEAPVALLPTHSSPSALAGYDADSLPELNGKLLAVLNGSRGRVDLRGYLLVAVDPATGEVTEVMPAKPDDSPGSNFTAAQMNYRGSGFYPHRPIGVVVLPEGAVLLSIGGGRVLALRAR